jgi:ankyrin repeat protein
MAMLMTGFPSAFLPDEGAGPIRTSFRVEERQLMNWGRLFLMAFAALLLSAPSYAQTPEEAREHLRRLDISYSAHSFLDSARSDDYRAVKLFLLSGINPDIRDDDGMTSLMYAAKNGATLTSTLLLNYGADIHAVQDNGKTALHHAVIKKRASMAGLLLDYGAYPDSQDAKGMTPLMYAAEEGDTQNAEYLLFGGADVDAQAHDNRTALIFASQKGHIDLVETLLAAGADPDIRAAEGTAMDYAERARFFEIAHMLEKAGAE